MSNKETLQNYNNKLIKNNDDLQTVIDIINNLPEAGEGDGENLTEELTDYNTKLTTQEDQLLVIAEALKTKAAGSGESSNIFIQENEPKTKEGLWLESSDTTLPTNVTITNREVDLSIKQWNPKEDYEQLPYDFYLGSTAIVGTDIFIFFNQTSSGTNATYKYDTIKNTYTQLSNVPFDSNRSSASVIGTDVYIFGSSVSPNNQAYKYDTLKDEFTQLANIPYNAKNVMTVSYDKSVYLFGGTGGANNAYRYDIETNSYTKLTNMPTGSEAGRVTIVGDTIYMFGLGSAYMYMTKYNITTGKYTQIGTTYGAARCLPVPIGKYIYVLGSSYNDTVAVYCYRFDTTDDKMTRLSDLPYMFGQGGGGLVGDKIYLIGAGKTGNRRNVQTCTIDTFEQDSILLRIDKTNLYSTSITNKIRCDFIGYEIFKNHSILGDIVMYYGNGKKWSPIENLDYVSDGMIAWFDGYTKPTGSRWSSNIGSDYIYETTSKSLTYDETSHTYSNNANLTMITSADYYKEGYTIEVVGCLNASGWFITMNETASMAIGVDDTGNIRFINNDSPINSVFTNYISRTFGASLFLEDVVARGVKEICKGKASVNGCEWIDFAETAAAASLAYSNNPILCYYVPSTSGAGSYLANGYIHCIRIYNRQLTNEEIQHNHTIDKIRFNLSE